MAHRLYRSIRFMLRLCTKRMTTEWEEEFDGEPAVFCPNHAGAFGHMEMCVHFPQWEKLRPWMNAGMMNAKEVPAYVRQDYWWKPGSFWEPLLTRTLPYIAAVLVPPVLRSVPGVPVYHDVRVIKTFRKSIGYLKQGDQLVIFSEQPDGYGSHSPTLNSGFLQIAPMAYRQLGLRLKFYPVHIDHKERVFHVGPPVAYDPEVPLPQQTPRIMEAIRAWIQPGSLAREEEVQGEPVREELGEDQGVSVSL